MNSCNRYYLDMVDEKIFRFIKSYKYDKIKPTNHNIKIISKYIMFNLPEHLKAADFEMKLDWIIRLSDEQLAEYIYSISSIEDVENYFVSKKNTVEKRLFTPKNPYIKIYSDKVKDNVDKCDKILQEIDLFIKNFSKQKHKINKDIKDLSYKNNIQ